MLALVGSGEYLPQMNPVDQYMFDAMDEDPRVICLPTAAGMEGKRRVEYWSSLGLEYFNKLGVSVSTVPVINQESANNNEFANKIQAANYIYISGGHPYYLYSTLKASIVWDAILQVYRRGGVIAGCSAGAMVMGTQFLSHLGWISGFNLIPGIIIPHYDEIPGWLKKLGLSILIRRKMMIGIDGFTAFIRDKKSNSIIGNGSVTVWDGSTKRTFRNGGRFDYPISMEL